MGRRVRLIARLAAAFVFFVCLLAARVGYAAITVQITSPAANAIEGASVTVTATVTSTYALSSVQAQVGSVTTSLTGLTGTLSLTNVALGPSS